MDTAIKKYATKSTTRSNAFTNTTEDQNTTIITTFSSTISSITFCWSSRVSSRSAGLGTNDATDQQHKHTIHSLHWLRVRVPEHIK